MVELINTDLVDIDLSGYDVDYLSVYKQTEDATKFLYSSDSGDVSITTNSNNHSKIYAGKGLEDAYGTAYSVNDPDVISAIETTVGNLKGNRDPAFFDNVYARGPKVGTVYVQSDYDVDPHSVEAKIKDKMTSIADEIKGKYDNVTNVTIQYTVTETRDNYIDTDDNNVTEDRMLGHLAVQISMEKVTEDEYGNKIVDSVTGFASVADTAGAELVFDNVEDVAYKALTKAGLQARAKPLPVADGETVRVLMGGDVTGVFVHEMLGHMAEADAVLDGNDLGKQFGNMVAPDFVNIKEVAQYKNGHGNIFYDNELQKAKDIDLVKNGQLVGFMTDRHTAVELKNKMGIDLGITGHGRSQDASYDPMVRMRNTILENGTTSHEDMLKQLGTGLYIVGSSGGYVYPSTGNFAVKTSEAFWVENGQLMFPVETSAISGNSLKTIQKIEALGDAETEENFAGFCGKGGWWSAQWAPVSGVGPDVLVSEMTVGEAFFDRDDLSNIPEDQIARPFQFESFGRDDNVFGRRIISPNGVLWW